MSKVIIEDEKKFIEICQKSQSMTQACVELGMHFNTFKKYAIQLNCYCPNQSHKGRKLGPKENQILTKDILAGKYPHYQTYKLKLRLLNEGIFQDGCQICGWCQKTEGMIYSPCELHHIDGNPHNHKLENLILICPNCHSLTDNYRSKNKSSKQEIV